MTNRVSRNSMFLPPALMSFLCISAPVFFALVVHQYELPLQGRAGATDYLTHARIAVAVFVLVSLPYMYVLEKLFLNAARKKQTPPESIHHMGASMAMSPFPFGTFLYVVGGTQVEFFGLSALAAIAGVVWWATWVRKRSYYEAYIERGDEATSGVH